MVCATVVFFWFGFLGISAVSVVRIIDGDSYAITAPFLPSPLKQTLVLRVAGIDTPEAGWRARCDRERQMARNAHTLVDHWFRKVGRNYLIVLHKWDKYGGRVLGNVHSNKKSIKQYLLEHGCAVAYSGRGQRHDWCQDDPTTSTQQTNTTVVCPNLLSVDQLVHPFHSDH